MTLDIFDTDSVRENYVTCCVRASASTTRNESRLKSENLQKPNAKDSRLSVHLRLVFGVDDDDYNDDDESENEKERSTNKAATNGIENSAVNENANDFYYLLVCTCRTIGDNTNSKHLNRSD